MTIPESVSVASYVVAVVVVTVVAINPKSVVVVVDRATQPREVGEAGLYQCARSFARLLEWE